MTTQALAVDHTNVHDSARARRLAEWSVAYRAVTPVEVWLVGQMVAQSLRVDDYQQREATLTAHLARRASLCWEADRCLAAEETAAGLSRRPAVVVLRLRRTRQGCNWLIARWRALGESCRDGKAWSEDQTNLAFDLLGTLRDERVGEPWDSAGSPEALVARETDRLERLRSESLDALDRAERAAAEAGVEVEPYRPLVALRREEAACMKRLHWARNQLPKAPRSVPAPHAPEPDPAPAPAPPCETRTDRELTDELYRAYEAELFRRILTAPDSPEPEVERTPTAVTPPATPRLNRKARRAALRRSL